MKQKSLKFKHIEDNLIKLSKLLVENQNIKRYIYYLDNDPLNPSKPDITEDLVESKHILCTLFDKTVLTEPKVRIFLNPLQGVLNNPSLSVIVFTLEIVIPSPNWDIEGIGKLRAFRIADEFAQDIDGQKVAGIGEVNITDFKTYKINESYFGMVLYIEINSSVGKGLRK